MTRGGSLDHRVDGSFYLTHDSTVCLRAFTQPVRLIASSRLNLARLIWPNYQNHLSPMDSQG